jgi:putative endonuclease
MRHARTFRIILVPSLSVIPAKAGIQYFRKMKQPCVYMLASKRNGTIYIGVTSNLVKRLYEHQSGAVENFTKKHGVHSLVWYVVYENMESAIVREKQMKKWNRTWKLRLIEEGNPGWSDLSSTNI